MRTYYQTCHITAGIYYNDKVSKNWTPGQQKGEKRMDTILESQNISLIAKDKIILKNINLKVQKGALLAILGESGSGKSTMLRVIDGWEEPSAGRVLMI